MKNVDTVDLSNSIQSVNVSVVESEVSNTNNSTQDASWMPDSSHHAYFGIRTHKGCQRIANQMTFNLSGPACLSKLKYPIIIFKGVCQMIGFPQPLSGGIFFSAFLAESYTLIISGSPHGDAPWTSGPLKPSACPCSRS